MIALPASVEAGLAKVMRQDNEEAAQGVLLDVGQPCMHAAGGAQSALARPLQMAAPAHRLAVSMMRVFVIAIAGADCLTDKVCCHAISLYSCANLAQSGT